MDLGDIIEYYNDIHEAAYKYMRANPEILGQYQWLRPAISENDFRISVTANGSILCYGSTYTMQTKDYENFEFEISLEDLRKSL